jgi:hypothetical protein
MGGFADKRWLLLAKAQAGGGAFTMVCTLDGLGLDSLCYGGASAEILIRQFSLQPSNLYILAVV